MNTRLEDKNMNLKMYKIPKNVMYNMYYVMNSGDK